MGLSRSHTKSSFSRRSVADAHSSIAMIAGPSTPAAAATRSIKKDCPSFDLSSRLRKGTASSKFSSAAETISSAPIHSWSVLYGVRLMK